MLSQPIADKIRLKLSEVLGQSVLVVPSSQPISADEPTWIVPITYDKYTVGYVIPGNLGVHHEDLTTLIHGLAELMLHQEILIAKMQDHPRAEPEQSTENRLLGWLGRGGVSFKTLDAYFEQAMSITHAADQLGIHRNTLVYRLEGITKSLGLDPRIFNQAIQIRLAMHELGGQSKGLSANLKPRLDTEMLATIEAFLLHNLNAADAANSLGIHRNTLIYRLDKAHKSLGLNPRHFDDALQIQLALKNNS